MEPMDSIPGPPGDLPDPGGIPIAEPALDPAANSEGIGEDHEQRQLAIPCPDNSVVARLKSVEDVATYLGGLADPSKRIDPQGVGPLGRIGGIALAIRPSIGCDPRCGQEENPKIVLCSGERMHPDSEVWC